MAKKTPKKLYVRFSTPKDEAAIFDFYNKNQHEFIFQRDPEVWKERIRAGAITVIDDEKGNIVAASISYPVMDGETHRWTEVGSTRVALAGIGLFDPLVSAQVLRAYLLEPPKDRFVLEIIHGNAHSVHVFGKLGATLFNIPKTLEDIVRATIVPGTAKDPVDWYQIGTEAMPAIAARFLESQKDNIRVDKKTGEEYELDFSRCVLATRFKAEVAELSRQNFGNPAQPDHKKPLKPPFKPRPPGPRCG
jgi:hypothetical protein